MDPDYSLLDPIREGTNVGEQRWDSMKVAVIGGDEREVEVARLYAASGCAVSLFGGCDAGDDQDVAHPATLDEALTGADVIVCPMPGVSTDNHLYAPYATEPIELGEREQRLAATGAVGFVGHATSAMRAAGEAAGVTWIDMGADDFLQVRHAIPTAEGAIATAIYNTSEPLSGNAVTVIGYGRIGVVLAAMLHGLGARVTVAARRPEVRARAEALGYWSTGTSPDEVIAAVNGSLVSFATAPARLLTATVLATLRSDVLIIDLASPPGCVDHASIGPANRVIWARGQASTSVSHSARAQFDVMAAALDARRTAVPVASGGL